MRKRGIMEGKRQLVEIEGGVLESDSEPKNDGKFIGVSFLYAIACIVCVAPFRSRLWLCIFNIKSIIRPRPNSYSLFSAKLIEDCHPIFSMRI